MTTQAQKAKALAEGAVEVFDRLIKLSDFLDDQQGWTLDQRLAHVAEQFVAAGISMDHFHQGPSALLQWAGDLAHEGIASAQVEYDSLLRIYGHGSSDFSIVIPLTLFNSAVLLTHATWGTEAYPYAPLALV